METLSIAAGNQGKPSPPFSQSIEVLPDDTKAYALKSGAREYQFYRVRGLYGGIPQ
jgi:hypothetical protein